MREAVLPDRATHESRAADSVALFSDHISMILLAGLLVVPAMLSKAELSRERGFSSDFTTGGSPARPRD